MRVHIHINTRDGLGHNSTGFTIHEFDQGKALNEGHAYHDRHDLESNFEKSDIPKHYISEALLTHGKYLPRDAGRNTELHVARKRGRDKEIVGAILHEKVAPNLRKIHTLGSTHHGAGAALLRHVADISEKEGSHLIGAGAGYGDFRRYLQRVAEHGIKTHKFTHVHEDMVGLHRRSSTSDFDGSSGGGGGDGDGSDDHEYDQNAFHSSMTHVHRDIRNALRHVDPVAARLHDTALEKHTMASLGFERKAANSASADAFEESRLHHLGRMHERGRSASLHKDAAMEHHLASGTFAQLADEGFPIRKANTLSAARSRDLTLRLKRRGEL